MDPLSMTLSVVTLATAIKDIIELAERIENSFSKVSQNLRNAQVFSTEIRETLYQLKEFCEQHYEVLNTTNETKNAVRKLHTKMSLVYTNCISLLPPSSEKRMKRFKISLQAWRNRDKIEAAISDLKNEVKKCYADFMLFALMRIETRLDFMHQTNIQGMEIVKREVSGTLRVSDQNVVAIAESRSSTSMPLLRTPSNIRDEVISDMYLRIQIDSIADSLTQLSSMDLSYIPETADCYIHPYQPLLDSSFLPGDRKNLHRDIVARSLEIRNILENSPTEVSIQEGAWDLVNLTIGLYYLNMHEEAATMGQWTVNLFRTLVSVDQATYIPYLIHSLKHLSRFYEDINNSEGSFLAIEEATELSRALQTPNTSVELRIQYGGTLTTYARGVGLKGDNTRAIELAEEAVKLLEEILQIDTIPYVPYAKVDGIVEVNQDFLIYLFHFSGASDQAICNYARALRQLSNCLNDDGRSQECLDVKLRALPIFQTLPGLYTDSTMDVELAGILFDFISQECKNLLPSERLLGYADDCITIYRKYADDNAALYGRSLCDALWEKANILGGMKRDDEALEVWKEIAELAKKLVEDQMYLADALYQVSWSFRRLKRHDEAATTRNESVMTYQSLIKTNSSAQANGYYDLSVDLQLAGRFEESVQAAQNAVTQYRALAFEDPDTWTKEIGRGLNALTNSYLSARQCDNALNEGYEAMCLFEKLISKDASVIQLYIYCLRVNFGVAFTSDNESRAIERSKDILRHFRALSVDYPKEVALGALEAELELGHNLDRLNRMAEARSHLEELLNKWDPKYPYAEEAAIVNLHISALISYASVLDNQGHTELALAPMLKAMEVGTPLCGSSEAVASQTVGAMYRRAHLLCELGRYAESLEAGLKTLEFARTTKMDNLAEFVGSLHVVALAAEHNLDPEKVVEVSQEAVEVCRGPAMQEYIKINRRALFFLPRSLEFLAGGLADCGKPAEGLEQARAAVEEALKLKTVSRVSWADAEPVYMSARGCLATGLLANNSIVDAIGLLEEMRTYYTERVKDRNGIYTDLGVCLRRLGILYCSVGRHEDGKAMADELSKIKARLAAVFPSLTRLMEFDLKHDMDSPSMKVLREAKINLKCHHQDEDNCSTLKV